MLRTFCLSLRDRVLSGEPSLLSPVVVAARSDLAQESIHRWEHSSAKRILTFIIALVGFKMKKSEVNDDDVFDASILMSRQEEGRKRVALITKVGIGIEWIFMSQNNRQPSLQNENVPPSLRNKYVANDANIAKAIVHPYPMTNKKCDWALR